MQILFTATNYERDVKTPPVKHLMAIAEKNNKEITKQALYDWYVADKKDYLEFARKYPVNEGLEKQDEKVEAMRRWCDEIKVAFTPTFFVNGKQLPEIYNISDMHYFL